MIEEKSNAALQRYRRLACSLILAELKLVRWFIGSGQKAIAASLDGANGGPKATEPRRLRTHHTRKAKPERRVSY
ncbi:hypothetical protein EOA75_31175 [Mesorhizobium sp. M1A.F.Ca.IN.022.07.1.1]|uniref:hypothetical protein n=1 Tax=Mesorhizobium sp. M1A.F.Ca.IN.022.07.1.1 TaxID=2496767 RepID=UPI000FCABE21|nr:hypothetical protein [Mesorhizobium sp. M1A.F.Ca.IN.022.07.1.1]RUV81830.1 hypothetical protein EOA75_31175 [Mesorhizobium sp. M1A.F.Ca.IN.022.07.1.1]TIS69815.1 MAG: hypothetical protein E5X11_06760 [Mesorhizobium sp.]